MRKRRILQFPISNAYGGITNYAINNWMLLDKTKFECDFATMSKQLDFEQKIIESGAGVVYISQYPQENKEQFVKEMMELLDREYDVVHLHTGRWKDLTIEKLCKKVGVKKVIVHSHNSYCGNQDETIEAEAVAIHNRVKNEFTENMATDYWACSQKAADWLFGEQIPREKIKIMPNAIDLDKFSFDRHTREKKRIELGISLDDYVIGCVGRISYQKNQRMLIKAFALAHSGDEKYKLLLVGTGPDEPECKKLARELGVNRQVVFAGMRYDIADIYHTFDIFALASRYEGLPISIIEAQASGLVCLVNETIANEVFITPNCLKVQNELDAWKIALKEVGCVYPRNGYRDKMAAAGYDIKRQIKIIEKEYSE